MAVDDQNDVAGAPPVNPYAAPTPESQGGDVPLAGPLDRADLEAFVGRNGAYYWDRALRGGPEGRLLVGWNWAAFFLNVFWMLYRRMYREVAVVFGVLAMTTVLAELAGREGGRVEDRILRWLTGGVLGIVGNGLYLRKVRRALAEVASETDRDRRQAALRRSGGTSWLAVVLGLLVINGLALFELMRVRGW